MKKGLSTARVKTSAKGTVKSVRSKETADLTGFALKNPWSRIEHKSNHSVILNPWNDASLVIFIPRTDFKAANTIAHVILPERFNGIYHSDKKELEFIFSSAFDPDEPDPSTAFVFRFKGREHPCRYGSGSDALLFLSRNYRPLASRPVSSDYRYLDAAKTAQLYKKLPKWLKETEGPMRVISFFVSNVETYDEEEVTALAKHLNFYMAYFERQSPQIEIRTPASTFEEEEDDQALRAMPNSISAKYLDPFLLDLNLAAKIGEPRLRFLYYYQILEYAAFYWVDDTVRSSIYRILQTPDLLSGIDLYYPKLIEALVPTRMNDEHKIRRVIESRVDPKKIWEEISKTSAYFAESQCFEGGFKLEPFAAKDMTPAGFCTIWSPKLPDVLRSIRNSLVHARESRTEAVISPTAANDARLEPWVNVIRRVAEEVTVFDS